MSWVRHLSKVCITRFFSKRVSTKSGFIANWRYNFVCKRFTVYIRSSPRAYVPEPSDPAHLLIKICVQNWHVEFYAIMLQNQNFNDFMVTASAAWPLRSLWILHSYTGNWNWIILCWALGLSMYENGTDRLFISQLSLTLQKINGHRGFWHKTYRNYPLQIPIIQISNKINLVWEVCSINFYLVMFVLSFNQQLGPWAQNMNN